MTFSENPTALPPSAPSERGSFEQERREVLDSVFEALCRHPPDPDEMAACAYLVKHLTGEAPRAHR